MEIRHRGLAGWMTIVTRRVYSQKNSADFVPSVRRSTQCFVRRLFELTRALKIPLYTCFIDLQKAYDPVHCDVLRTVLPRYEIPPQQSANSMMARGRAGV